MFLSATLFAIDSEGDVVEYMRKEKKDTESSDIECD